MKNADMPAMPLPRAGDDDYVYVGEFTGMSKREYAAIKIMAGLAANVDLTVSGKVMASLTKGWVDDLFEALED